MYSKQFIRNQLEEMNIAPGVPIIMHTALRAVGDVEGRAEGLLEVVRDYVVERGGLLLVPTHTWTNLETNEEFALDMTKNQTCIGTFSNVALTVKGGVRTKNPSHSVVIFGKEDVVKEYVDLENKQITPTSPNGCYGKVFVDDGYVLLVGVGQEKNTCLHCVEEMLKLPNRLSDEPIDMKIKMRDGSVSVKKFHYMRSDVIKDVSVFFPKYEIAFRTHGAITDGKLGNAKIQLCSAKKIQEVMELIYKRSGGEEILKDATPLKEDWYK